MSTLIVDVLENNLSLTQAFRIRRNINVAHIRPWLYLSGTLPDGQLRMRLKQGSNILKTVTIDYTEINNAKTETYAHGFLRFDFDSLVLNRNESETATEYIIELTMLNHTDSSSNYIAWAREWDLKSHTLYGSGTGLNNQGVNDEIEPYGFQIYEFRRS